MSESPNAHKYDLWLKSKLRSLIHEYEGENVQSQIQTVVYSGPSFDHGKSLKFSNRRRAEDFAKRESAITLESTGRGEYLEKNQKMILVEAAKIAGLPAASAFLAAEWTKVSQDYALLARGNIRAFVAGAKKGRVFRKTELPALISNPRVVSINGVSRRELEKVIIHVSEKDRKSDLHWDRVYSKITVAGLHLDMRQAIRTGNEHLILDALVQRKIHQDQMRLDHGGSKLTDAQQKQRLDRLKDRASSLSQTSQNRMRLTALHDLRTITDRQAQQGTISDETAQMRMQRSAQLLQNPHNVYRISQLAALRLRKAKLSEDDSSSLRDVHAYITAREQYMGDIRAVRQIEHHRFRDVEPLDAIVERNHRRRSIAERARHQKIHRRSDEETKAQASFELDTKLEAQRKQDEHLVARRITVKPRPAYTAAHGIHLDG